MNDDQIGPVLPAAVREQLPEAVQTVPMAPGATNRLWRLEAGDQRWVWRQFVPAPGVDRNREHSIMQALQGRSWMPTLLAWTPEGMLLPWLEGRTPEPADLDGRARAALPDLLVRLWRHPLPEVPAWDYPALVRGYAADCPDTPRWHRLADRLVRECSQWPQAEPCLMHHDLHPGNLLLAGRHWTLLDWEFAARGNPWIDAVCLDRWLGLSHAERERLQPMLEPHAVTADPWGHYRNWVEGLDALWYAARDQGRGSPRAVTKS
ncbi:MAG: phosphotransferase [Natronospirillum sp.]|uniref:phosphotransferase n=1 Tax=Natronospirillum sp. TaxID=2812955 RepID=UPI0025FA1A7B|nr:phosphotransferase [Natronospirillum sp.]MCH8553260.1 phosphotransferase [Natronospirillum sp.]